MAETEQAPSSSGRNIFRSTTRIVLLGFGVGAGYGIAAWIIVALIGAVQDFTDGQSLSSVVKPPPPPVGLDRDQPTRKAASGIR